MDVSALVSTDYVSVAADTRVSRLVGAFDDPELKGIVVTDDGDYLGVVTRRQLAVSHRNPDEKARSLLRRNVPRIEPGTDVREAARLMVDGDTHLLPVFEGPNMRGVVTANAILEAVESFLDVASVGDVATDDPVSVGPEDTFGEAINVLREHRITHLPVVEDGDAVGILSLYDLVDLTARDVDRSQGGDAVSDMGRGGFGAREGERDRILDLPVRDLMVSPVHTIRPAETLETAVQRMFEAGTSSLVVVDGEEHLAGIVTKTDVLDALTWEAEGSRAVQVSGVAHLTDGGYHDVVELIEDLERVAGSIEIHDAKVHLHRHDEKVRGRPLVLASIRLYTDEGTYIASGEDYGAMAALREAKDTLERRIRDDKTYGRSKKPRSEEYWNKRFGWWLEGGE